MPEPEFINPNSKSGREINRKEDSDIVSVSTNNSKSKGIKRPSRSNMFWSGQAVLDPTS